MQPSVKAASRPPCTSYVLLSLSLLVSLLPAAATAPGHARGPILLTLRSSAQEIQADDGDSEPAVTQAPPVSTTDMGKAMVREATDIAWKAAGEATEARAATSKLRSKINKIGAGVHSAQAKQFGDAGTKIYLPQAQNAEASTRAYLEQTLKSEAEVKKILESVDDKAYKVAQDAAAKEVGKLEMEAKKYFQSLLAKFRAMAEPGPPTAADAAAKAAQPYIDVELRVGALVQYYNEKALAEIASAHLCASQAQIIARQAQAEQTAGIVDMAQRHMMQAHMLVGTANLKKQGAWNIRKLAESLNMSMPSYQRAAQMAAAHALATFSGLQMSDKAHSEMRQKVGETTRQVDEGFAKLDESMTQTLKVLAAIEQ